MRTPAGEARSSLTIRPTNYCYFERIDFKITIHSCEGEAWVLTQSLSQFFIFDQVILCLYINVLPVLVLE